MEKVWLDIPLNGWSDIMSEIQQPQRNKQQAYVDEVGKSDYSNGWSDQQNAAFGWRGAAALKVYQYKWTGWLTELQSLKMDDSYETARPNQKHQKIKRSQVFVQPTSQCAEKSRQHQQEKIKTSTHLKTMNWERF